MRLLLRIAPFLLAALALAATPGLRAQDLSELGRTAEEMEEDNPFRLTGSVRGPQGPAEGVQLYLELRDMRDRRPFTTLTARTNSEGRYSFDLSRWSSVPEFGMEVVAVSPRFVQSSQILRRSRTELPAALDFDLVPGSSVRGVVVDVDGQPLEGVLIQGGSLRPSRSDERGEWEMNGLPVGPTELRFFLEGYAEGVQAVAPTQPSVLTGFRVELPSARTLGGVVVDRFGGPVPRADLSLGIAGRVRRARADAGGRFEFVGVPADLAGAEIRVQGGDFLPTTRRLTAAEIDALEAEVVLHPGVWLAGTLALPNGEPVSSSQVVDGREMRNAWIAETDADGRWRLGPYPPGVEVIVTGLPPAGDSSWAIAQLLLQPAGADGVHPGRVELWPRGFSSSFRGEFRDGTATLRRRDTGAGGLSGEVVYTAEWDGESDTMAGTIRVPALEQEGEFTARRSFGLAGGLSGQWEIRERLGPSRLNAAPVQARVRTGIVAAERVVDLSLQQGRTLRGQAIRADGEPFIDGEVVLSGWNNNGIYRLSAPIQAAGRFTMERVPDGLFLLEARSRDGADMTPPAIVHGDDGTIVLRATPPGPDPMDD